jgi:hypothetical protein
MFKRFTEAIFANFRLKLLALAISLGVWFYANSRLVEELPITATIAITPPQGTVLVYQSDRTARLRIEGPRSLMETVRDEAISGALRMKYDMKPGDAHGGWATLELRSGWLQLGLHEYEAVQLSSRNITPAAVSVFVSPVADKALPVRVALTGEPPPGLRIQGEPATAPSQVVVRGPEIALNSMDSISTEDVALWKLTPGVFEEPRVLRRSVTVTLDNGQRVDVPVEPQDSTVQVHMRVAGETLTQQTFSDLPLGLLLPLQFPFEAEVEEGERTISVTVTAGAEELKKLTAADIRPYVDLTGLATEQIAPGASGPYREPVVVHLPIGLAVDSVQATPALVTVLLKNPAK